MIEISISWTYLISFLLLWSAGTLYVNYLVYRIKLTNRERKEMSKEHHLNREEIKQRIGNRKDK
uniref:MbpT n=1 Tax=Staphylococcus phage 184DA TaxID=3110532 RepID=A0AAU6MXK7_9CAUD